MSSDPALFVWSRRVRQSVSVLTEEGLSPGGIKHDCHIRERTFSIAVPRLGVSSSPLSARQPGHVSVRQLNRVELVER